MAITLYLSALSETLAVLHIADLNWLAGWLEGEGCFFADKKRNQLPVVQANSTDLDTITRAAKLMEATRVGNPELRPGYKPIYYVKVTGYRAANVMRQILPLMGERRSQKITEVLAGWIPKRLARGPHSAPLCHPGRKHGGFGLCKSCYDRQHKRKKVA